MDLPPDTPVQADTGPKPHTTASARVGLADASPADGGTDQGAPQAAPPSAAASGRGPLSLPSRGVLFFGGGAARKELRGGGGGVNGDAASSVPGGGSSALGGLALGGGKRGKSAAAGGAESVGSGGGGGSSSGGGGSGGGGKGAEHGNGGGVVEVAVGFPALSRQAAPRGEPLCCKRLAQVPLSRVVVVRAGVVTLCAEGFLRLWARPTLAPALPPLREDTTRGRSLEAFAAAGGKVRGG